VARTDFSGGVHVGGALVAGLVGAPAEALAGALAEADDSETTIAATAPRAAISRSDESERRRGDLRGHSRTG
jgi:hypothetical protein